MSKIIIFTDGSANNALQGKGGYGIVMINGTVRKFCGGQYENTTSARMELLAVIRALQKCAEFDEIVVYSDSEYCVNVIRKGWLFKWMKNKWSTCKNGDLMKELHSEYSRLRGKVTMVHVRGHNGDHYNEMADKLAKQGSKSETIIIDRV